MFYEVIAIAFGGALGSVARFLLSNSMLQIFGDDFPYGTLTVNVAGSFLMGVLAVLIMDRMPQYNAPLAGFILVGLLGGFTTFSTFSMETLRLIFEGHFSLGFLNIFTNVIVCLGATMIGYFIAMKVFGLGL